MDKLIVKYLNNELDHKEWKELQTWLEEDDLNKAYFNKIEAYWKNSDGKVISARRNVLERLESELFQSKVPTRRNKTIRLVKIAASFLLLCALSFLFYRLGYQSTPPEKDVVLMIEKETNPGQRLTTKLPDGSIVTLNSGTKLKFPEKFDDSERVVDLSGEAFFEVEHNKDKPFIVRSNGSAVKVLGTSFNVRTYIDEEIINVAVATGKVSFTSPNNIEGVILSQNQMISYKVGQKDLSIMELDALDAFGWRNKILYFKNSEIKDIIKELERWYGVSVEAERDFSHKGNFTGEFENKSLENVLIGLSYLYDFDFTIENETVILK